MEQVLEMKDIRGLLKKSVFKCDFLKFFLIWFPDMILVSAFKKYICMCIYVHTHTYL